MRLRSFARSVTAFTITAIAPLFALGAQDPATLLAESMWAAQTDARSVRLSWNHIAGGAVYTVSCETAKPLKVLGSVSPGVAVKDLIGLPRRVSYVIPGVEIGVVHRCYLQWASDPKAALSARVPFNEVTPVVPGTIEKPAPPTVTARATAPGQITVTWNATPNATAYTLGRSIQPDGFKPLCVVCSTTTTFVDRYAKAGARHTYSVAPITPAGALLGSRSNTLIAAGTTDEIVVASDPTVNPDLKRPSGVTATLSAATTVMVKWNAVDGAAGYDVFRSVNGGSLQLVGHLPGAAPPATVELPDYIGSLTAAGSNQMTVRYAVKSTDSNGRATEPTMSNELTIESKAGTPAGTSSTTASNTRATATSSSSVTLTWSPPVTSISCSLQRSLSGGAYAMIATLPVGTTQYVDAGQGLLDQRPRYRIVCGDPKTQVPVAFPNPEWSGPKPTTPPPPAASSSATVPASLRAVAASPDTVRLTWGPPTSAIACAVRRSLRGDPYVIIQVMPVGAWQYTDTLSGLLSMKPRYELSCGDPKSPYPPVAFPNPV